MVTCKSEYHVQSVALSEELCVSSVPVPASADRLQSPRCPSTGRRVANGSRRLRPFEESLSGQPTRLSIAVVEQPVVEPRKITPDVLRVSSEEESINLHVFAERSRRPNKSKPNGRHNFLKTLFPKDPHREVCKLDNTVRAACRHRPGPCSSPQFVGGAITADRKDLDEENESCSQHRYAVLVQDLFLVGFKSYSTKKKTPQETTNSLRNKTAH